MATTEKQSTNETQKVSNEPPVITLKYTGYSHIVFNRPHRLNTINPEFTNALFDNLKRCEEDDDTKFIILRGVGRAFCAGGDIKDLLGATGDDETFKKAFNSGIIKFHEAIYYMGCVMKTPIIAIMNGITYGGGIGFAQLSTFKIATENTVFAFPEAAIGHFCDASASFFIPRMEGHLGIYLGLTGHGYKAEEALFAGLATHFMNSSKLQALEKRLSELSVITLDAIDEAIQDFSVSQKHVPSHYTLYGEKLNTIKRCFQFDTVEEIISALNQENSSFARICLKSIASRSPTSLKVTMATSRRGKKTSMAECLSYEFRAWLTLPYEHDYKEGVNSLLSKKQPQWYPAKLEDIDEEYVCQKLLAKVKITPPYMDLAFDCNESPHTRFHLPTAQEVDYVQKKHDLKTYKEIITWFVNDRHGKFGVEQKVNDILTCKRLDNIHAKL